MSYKDEIFLLLQLISYPSKVLDVSNPRTLPWSFSLAPLCISDSVSVYTLNSSLPETGSSPIFPACFHGITLPGSPQTSAPHFNSVLLPASHGKDLPRSLPSQPPEPWPGLPSPLEACHGHLPGLSPLGSPPVISCQKLLKHHSPERAKTLNPNSTGASKGLGTLASK